MPSSPAWTLPALPTPVTAKANHARVRHSDASSPVSNGELAPERRTRPGPANPAPGRGRARRRAAGL